MGLLTALSASGEDSIWWHSVTSTIRASMFFYRNLTWGTGTEQTQHQSSSYSFCFPEAVSSPSLLRQQKPLFPTILALSWHLSKETESFTLPAHCIFLPARVQSQSLALCQSCLILANAAYGTTPYCFTAWVRVWNWPPEQAKQGSTGWPWSLWVRRARQDKPIMN